MISSGTDSFGVAARGFTPVRLGQAHVVLIPSGRLAGRIDLGYCVPDLLIAD